MLRVVLTCALVAVSSAGPQGGPPPCVFTGTCTGTPPPGIFGGAGGPPPSALNGAGGPPPGVSAGAGGPPPGVFAVAGEGDSSFVPPSTGPCATPPVVDHFNLHRYLGRWYEIERMFNPFQNGDCVIADYSLNPNDTVRVVNSNYIDGVLDVIEGTATPAPGTEGRLNVVFPDTRGFQDANRGSGPNYNIVATDYDNYAVVYSCTTFQIPGQASETKLEFSWFLARRPKASPQFVPRLKSYLDQVGIDSTRYIATNQDNCQRRPLDQLIQNIV